ncbi:PaaI family thioesterase [Candidatus Fermentibacteria bacterium]|nr:PaaI family thioesterase [Candidatus Fermentibacteria bacterium]
MTDFRNDGYCFVCGQSNPSGLRLKPEGRDGACSLTWIPRREHQGWEGIVHGGILSAVLDEVMAYSTMSLAGATATTSLRIEFKKPVLVGKPVEISAQVVSRRGRILDARARLSQEGILKAEAEARFLAVPGEGGQG